MSLKFLLGRRLFVNITAVVSIHQHLTNHIVSYNRTTYHILPCRIYNILGKPYYVLLFTGIIIEVLYQPGYLVLYFALPSRIQDELINQFTLS
jgi:hypothetical protein